MRIFLFNFSIFQFSNILFCDKFCYLRTHTNIFQFLNLLGEVGFGKVILTLNIPNVTNPIAPWSAARTQREKYFQVVSQRNTSGQVCVFKMSPILKHSDHVLRFSVFCVVKKYRKMQDVAYVRIRDLLKSETSTQDVVRMFQNWAHFVDTYLP